MPRATKERKPATANEGSAAAATQSYMLRWVCLKLHPLSPQSKRVDVNVAQLQQLSGPNQHVIGKK